MCWNCYQASRFLSLILRNKTFPAAFQAANVNCYSIRFVSLGFVGFHSHRKAYTHSLPCCVSFGAISERYIRFRRLQKKGHRHRECENVCVCASTSALPSLIVQVASKTQSNLMESFRTSIHTATTTSHSQLSHTFSTELSRTKAE